MKHQVLFSLKNNEKMFMNVVCCSRDWGLRVNIEIRKFHLIGIMDFETLRRHYDPMFRRMWVGRLMVKLVGCFVFNGHLRQYFSLYRAVAGG